jgi:hypothetical protein
MAMEYDLTPQQLDSLTQHAERLSSADGRIILLLIATLRQTMADRDANTDIARMATDTVAAANRILEHAVHDAKQRNEVRESQIARASAYIKENQVELLTGKALDGFKVAFDIFTT